MTLHAEAIERKQIGAQLTADGLLRRRASQRPGVTALCDPPNLEALGFGVPKTLSYRDADAAVDALASFFIQLGLEPGDTIAAQLPNLALAPLTLLGAWRAGLTVAAVPMLWRAEEIAKVCEQVAPQALIGVSSFVGEKRAETLCAVAAAQRSIRFVLGVGRDLPDGIVSLDEAIAENGIDRHLRYRHKVRTASWSGVEKRWTVEAEQLDAGQRFRFTCNFLWMCQGYYDHEQGYTPEWPGMQRFRGQIVHPQTWPEDLEYAGKRVLVIGSGATAATVVPAMANECEHITPATSPRSRRPPGSRPGSGRR